MAKGCMAVPWGHDSKLSSFRGIGFKANDGYKKLMFYDILCQSFLRSIKQSLVIKRKFKLLCSLSPCFRARSRTNRKGQTWKT